MSHLDTLSGPSVGGDTEERLTRHKDYYFADGSVTVLVERTLFKVHKYLFRESPVFSNMFARRSRQGTDEDAIKLIDVTPFQFSHLCRYIYTPQLDFEARFSASFEEWAAIFDLATRFNFFEISSAAVREIASTQGRTVEKIAIAKKADQECWLFELYETLCRQPFFISEAEGELLGMKEVVLLAKAREEYIRGTTGSSILGPADIMIEKYFSVKRQGKYEKSAFARVRAWTDEVVLSTSALRTVCAAASLPAVNDDESSDTQSINTSPLPPGIHPDYYFEDGSVVFLVENVFFRVHKYLFETSLLFKDMFALPQGNSQPEGVFDDLPIRLRDVKANDFACICRFMYRPTFYEKFSGSFAEWRAIFNFSAKFMFDNISPIAKRELERFDGYQIEKITIAKQHDLRDWLPPLYAWICQRPEFVSDEEAKVLGFSTVLKLARIRERRVGTNSYARISAEDVAKEMSDV